MMTDLSHTTAANTISNAAANSPNIPSSVADYLIETALQDRAAAYLQVTAQGHLIDSGGHLQKYGLQAIAKGDYIGESFYYIEGFFPLKRTEVLPYVQLDSGLTVDVHIIASASQKTGHEIDCKTGWVLLLDKTAEAQREQKLQQKSNDLSLLRQHYAQLNSLDRSSDRYKQDSLGQGSGNFGVSATSSVPSLGQPGGIYSMNGSLLLSKVLSTLEILSLEWHASNQLSVVGELPQWAQQEFDCFEAITVANRYIEPDRFSPFLENFLIDAKAFWQAQSNGILKSGIWTEISQSGKELHLEAIALYVREAEQDRRILLIESAALSDEKFRWLQTAREEQLHFISERKIAATKILSATFYDPLTGLPNRKLFLSQLSGFFQDAREGNRTPFALIIINIDRFQNLNSNLGTAPGDEAIKVLSERIRDCLRSHDVPGRFGGDEFGILIGKTERTQDIVAIVRRLLRKISEPILLEERPITLTASAGVAIYDGRYERSRDLLRDASLAMHQAKNTGKGRYALFNHEMRSQALELWNIETALRIAIRNRELQLWYQPIVDVATRQVESFEVLIRWEHSDYSWIPPAKFIPLAEDSGLITEIDKWVLETACQTIEQWERNFGLSVRLNVNISSRHFSEANLFVSVRDAISAVNISPELLRLEITESSLLADTQTAVKTLNRLKDLGVEIAIDDFGTGYASLSYLQDLPLNKLKIDGYFIEMMSINGSSIVETIIKLSHQLGFGVTAERVETVEQYETLRRLGCDTVQGYLFSKPVLEEKARSLIGTELESIS